METRLLTGQEIKTRLQIKYPMQFKRVLPDLCKFGAFKLPGTSWRMYEEDYNRFILAKQEEAKKQ